MGVLELIMLSKEIHSVKAMERTGDGRKETSRENKDWFLSNKIKRKKSYIVKSMKSNELCMK